jgi:beta-lactamase regulating signal transducer with metallopeptidase domain
MNEWQGLALAVLLVVMAEIANEIMIALFRVKNATTRFRIRLISLLSCFFVFFIVPLRMVELTILGENTLPGDLSLIDPSYKWGVHSAMATPTFSRFGQVSLILVAAAVVCCVFMFLFSKYIISRVLWCEPAHDIRLLTLVEDVSRELGVTVKQVMICWKKCDAFVYGYPPVLAVGKDLLDLVDEEELRIIIKHELHHIKGKDTLLKPVLTALCIIFMYNPMIWFLYKKLFADRECSCDQASITSSKDTRTFLSLLLKFHNLAQGAPYSLAVHWIGATHRIDSLFLYEKTRKIPVIVCFFVTFSSLFVGGTQLFEEQYVEIGSSAILDTVSSNYPGTDAAYFSDRPLAELYEEIKKEVEIPLHENEFSELLNAATLSGNGVTIKIATRPIGRKKPETLKKDNIVDTNCTLIIDMDEKGRLYVSIKELKEQTQKDAVLTGVETPL